MNISKKPRHSVMPGSPGSLMPNSPGPGSGPGSPGPGSPLAERHFAQNSTYSDHLPKGFVRSTASPPDSPAPKPKLSIITPGSPLARVRNSVIKFLQPKEKERKADSFSPTEKAEMEMEEIERAEQAHIEQIMAEEQRQEAIKEEEDLQEEEDDEEADEEGDDPDLEEQKESAGGRS